MSFILDALRKSEHARQRQTGPGLAEVPVAATKPKTNVWATAAVALLVVNLLAVGILLLRRAQKDDAAAAPDRRYGHSGRTCGWHSLRSGESNAEHAAAHGRHTGHARPAGARRVRAGAGPIDEPAGPGGRNPLADEVGTGSEPRRPQRELLPRPSLRARRPS